jgi:hypothetical protein
VDGKSHGGSTADVSIDRFPAGIIWPESAHAYMPNFAANQTMLAYILPGLRPDQKFLVTEFFTRVAVVQPLERHGQP